MIEFLAYPFLRRAFLVGLMLAVIIPCIGLIVVLRRLSMIGDALSHSSLAGVAAGLVMGVNPILGAMVACVLAALGIEAVRRKIPRYSEMSIAIILSAGVGVAAILSEYVSGAANFNSFLFGSIVAISDFEARLVAGVSAAVLLCFLLLYKELLSVAFDETGAKLSGVPVGFVNIFFTLLTAVTVSVAARTIGALIVSSLMVIPAACAMQLAGSFRRTLWLSIGLSVFFTVTGLILSYYLQWRPGGTIVLTGVLVLVLILMGKAVRARLRRTREPKPEPPPNKTTIE